MPHAALFARRAVLALCLAFPAACTADTAPASKPATQPATKSAATTPATLASAPYPVTFASTTMTLKGRQFTIEVATTEEQEARGLMYRDSMPASHGMLFVMPRLEPTKFWMQNTRIPLDILFLDQKGKVVDIIAAKPFDETNVGPSVPVRYVIELNQGTSEKIGLKVGDTVEIPAQYGKN
jgi:uncharacterized protein